MRHCVGAPLVSEPVSTLHSDDSTALAATAHRLVHYVIPFVVRTELTVDGLAAAEVSASSDDVSVSGVSPVTRIFHSNGINMRLLAVALEHCTIDAVRLAILSEMVARTVKSYLRRLQRHTTSIDSARAVAYRVLQLLVSESETSQKFWVDGKLFLSVWLSCIARTPLILPSVLQ
jgi:hypothetical protein